jgi:hypothetical protein
MASLLRGHVAAFEAMQGIRSRQLQHQNIQNKSDINDALAEAFEKGYRLGRTDAGPDHT